MAAEMGLSPEILETGAFSPDKGLEKTQTVSGLMERLRGRYGQHKSWADSIKAIRLAVVNDKRLQAEALEKSSLQNCLDKLHRAMKITNQQSFIERLDLISRQLGMIFTPPSHPENQVILSSDMFKVVIILDGQSIKDVRIRHQETPSSCEDMVEALSKGDFEEFVSHLQGLLAIYSIQGDRKQKIKGYLALSSLESDLNQLAQLQSSINGVANYIHKSPLGILLPRRGGHPMKLIYYVSPYDLLCKTTNSSYPMTVEAITEHGLGHSVTVSLEPCPHVNKLQTMPLMSVRTSQDGKSLQSFQNANTINSCSLSASFVLVLPQPLPLAKSVIDAIKDVTGLDVICDGEMQFLSLLLNHCSNESLTNKNELFVTLPDQQHVYLFNNSADSCLGQPGALVSKIPFTLPTCVPKVINLLRQQLMFNSVIHSLIRPYSKKVYKSGIVFEVTAISLQYLSLMFEHPLHHSMITVDFDLSDITSVKCNVNINNRDEDICSSDYVSRAFQRCFSIPVALRSVIKRVNEQVRLLSPPKPVCKPVVKSRWTWSSHNVVKRLHALTANNPVPIQNNVTSLPNPPPYSNTENWSQSPQIEMHKYSIQFNRFFSEPPVSTPEEFPEQRPAANPLLATLLDNDSPGVVLQSIPIVNESPMLSKLLEENTSVASNPFPAPTPNPRKRLTKRKSSKDISGKSPKHRISDSEMAERTINSERQGNERHGQGMGEKHIDLDSSGGSYEEMPRPSSVNSVGSTGAHSTGSIIDLTDIGESHVKKLENSLDSIMGKESPRGGAMMNMCHPMNNQLSALDVDLQFGDFHHSQHQHSMLGDGAFDFTPHPPWPSRQTPPTPTSRNSPHHGVVPKNEKTSTSLEELLLGPGGRENEGPNPAQPRRNSQQQRRSSLKRQNSLGRNSVDSAMGVISPDVFSPLMTSPSHHPLASPSQFPIPSPNYIVSPGIYPQMSPSQNPTVTSPNLQNVNPKNELSDSKIGILGSQMPVSGSIPTRLGGIHSGHVTSCGKPSLSMLKAQLDLKNDVKHNVSAIPQVDLDALKEENSNSSTSSSLKLKLSNKRHFDSVSLAEIDETKRSSTFDFHSDDEDFTLPRVEKMTVVSSSPTRLQISNKSTLASFNRFNKSEKYKRKQKEKELKLTLSVDSGKRKRERDDSRKEKKKKKLANNSYSVENERALYKSTTVVENVGNENDHYKPMPKLKITKEGVKLSIENSVLHSKDVKSGEKSIDKIEKAQKEAIVKIEKMERSLSRENSQKDLKVSKEKTAKHRDNNKSVEKDKFVAAIVRTPSTSDEGIFDKINAMKTEHMPKNGNENPTPGDKNSPHNSALKKSSSSSKLVKSHKSQRSSSSKSDSKVSRTPTIKLKPIVVTPSPNSCGLNISKSSSNPGTPSTPKSVTQSPTSTTIGKIGAVSLATSGSQKQLNLSNNKSPLGSANKLPASSKPSPVHSSLAPSKSSSSLQKNIQIQGPSGKNSPVLHSSNKSRSSSASSSSTASGLKSDKSLHKSLSSLRTSSPHSEKEKSKSRSSSASSRDREKSSSKSIVPTSTVITQETAASVLSFLNPNKIAKLPPIPKLSSSTSGGPRVSTPTSTSNPIVTTSPSSSSTTTVTTNSKLSKGVTSVSKSSPSSSNATSSKSNTSNSANVKTNHYSKHEKGNTGNQGNSSRSQNHNAGNTTFSNRNSTSSPQSISSKSSGALNKHEKGSNPSSTSSSGHRNNYNSASSQNRNSNSNSSGGQSQWGNNSTGSSQGNKLNHSNVSNQSAIRGSNSGYNGNKGNHSSDNTGNRTPPVNNHFSNSRGSNSIPNAPKGPGPPPTRQDSKNSAEKEKISGNSAIQSPRARKGSLSAVIDKLTCKAAVPANGNITSSSQKVDQVIVNESPASPELEPAVPIVQEDKKIVIFEAPASPEPESSVINTPKSHVASSSSETVSIPLENESGRSNMNDYTNERTKESLKRQDSSHLKSRSPLSSSPKVIPLNSPKEKPSSNKVVSSHKKGLTRQNSVDIINSIEKQNGELDENHCKSVHISICSSVHSVSNSSNQDASVFKIPTPKTQDLSYTENNTEDIENYIGHRNHRINSNSKLSDSTSPPSSPENGLIIDFPSSPRHLQNKTNSPQCNSLSDSITDSRTSPNFLKSPSVKGTPGKDKSGLGSSASSPECLEDDLMNEALGFGN